jgi:hypothetical protein
MLVRELDLRDRIDRRIERLTKRLTQLKTMKAMLGLGAPGRLELIPRSNKRRDWPGRPMCEPRPRDRGPCDQWAAQVGCRSAARVSAPTTSPFIHNL